MNEYDIIEQILSTTNKHCIFALSKGKSLWNTRFCFDEVSLQ